MKKYLIFLSVMALFINQVPAHTMTRGGDQPAFVPEYKADDYLKVDLKQKDGEIYLVWKSKVDCSEKTFHVLKGVINQDQEITWQIIKQFEPQHASNKFECIDPVLGEQAYYRIRVSEDGDQIEYTRYYLVE
ncbi:MAG: hypothetical protein ACNS62_20770 [Candidatus Cyclobacteriaceae bacterium M3_2C_046]